MNPHDTFSLSLYWCLSLLISLRFSFISLFSFFFFTSPLRIPSTQNINIRAHTVADKHTHWLSKRTSLQSIYFTVSHWSQYCSSSAPKDRRQKGQCEQWPRNVPLLLEACWHWQKNYFPSCHVIHHQENVKCSIETPQLFQLPLPVLLLSWPWNVPYLRSPPFHQSQFLMKRVCQQCSILYGGSHGEQVGCGPAWSSSCHTLLHTFWCFRLCKIVLTLTFGWLLIGTGFFEGWV